jgi:copper chaperone
MEKKNVKLRIYGMTCNDCVNFVESGLRQKDGVLDVKVSLKDGTGDVVVDQTKVKPEDLLRNPVFLKPSHYKATLIDQ